MPAYYEDTDLAFEVRRRGYRVVYCPRARVVHVEGVSHGQDPNAGVKQHQVRNQEVFRDKWATELDRDHFANGEHLFLARDRSRDRPGLLVIDHYVPHYDCDAGSRSTWQYLQLFVAAGHNVKFLGDNFYRHEPYTGALQDLGIEVLYGPEAATGWANWLRDAAPYLDRVYLHRPHVSEKYLDVLESLEPRPKLLYFGHDLHSLRCAREQDIGADTDEDADDWQRREFAIIDRVDVSYFPSQVEVDAVREARPRATVHRLPLNIWPPAPPPVAGFAQRSGLLFVGGFNHRPNVDGLLWFLDSVWPRISEQAPELVLHVVGSKAPEDIYARQSERVLVHGFISDERLAELYAEVRLSVVPLRFGAGVKGKVLESLFHGVPVIATAVGAEGIPASPAVIVADSPEDFAAATVNAYADAAAWSELSGAGRQLIGQHFSQEAVLEAIGEDFGLRPTLDGAA